MAERIHERPRSDARTGAMLLIGLMMTPDEELDAYVARRVRAGAIDASFARQLRDVLDALAATLEVGDADVIQKARSLWKSLEDSEAWERLGAADVEARAERVAAKAEKKAQREAEAAAPKEGTAPPIGAPALVSPRGAATPLEAPAPAAPDAGPTEVEAPAPVAPDAAPARIEAPALVAPGDVPTEGERPPSVTPTPPAVAAPFPVTPLPPAVAAPAPAPDEPAFMRRPVPPTATEQPAPRPSSSAPPAASPWAGGGRRGAPDSALPFAPAPAVTGPPAPPVADSALPFQAPAAAKDPAPAPSPAGESLDDSAPQRSGTAGSAAPPVAGATDGGGLPFRAPSPTLPSHLEQVSVEQYAYMVAAKRALPAQVEAVWYRYGVRGVDDWLLLEEHWRKRLEDPEKNDHFQRWVQHYVGGLEGVT